LLKCLEITVVSSDVILLLTARDLFLASFWLFTARDLSRSSTKSSAVHLLDYTRSERYNPHHNV